MWVDKGITKGTLKTPNNYLFFFEDGKEWKHTKVCNKEYKFREEKTYLNSKHFRTNVHLTARIMWICFEICQLLTPLKFVQILNKSDRALWKYVFIAQVWSIYFYYAVLSRSSSLRFESFHCESNFLFLVGLCRWSTTEEKIWKLVT